MQSADSDSKGYSMIKALCLGDPHDLNRFSAGAAVMLSKDNIVISSPRVRLKKIRKKEPGRVCLYSETDLKVLTEHDSEQQ